MRVIDIMTPDPACCTPDTTAREAATLMRDNDCGSIPVIDNGNTRRLVGIVTDWDLAIRGLAAGKGPGVLIRELMTEAPITNGTVVGIVAQADIALEEGAASDQEVGRVVEAISEPRSNLDPGISLAD